MARAATTHIFLVLVLVEAAQCRSSALEKGMHAQRNLDEGTHAQRNLDEVMIELKLAETELKFAKGKPANVEAVLKLKALIEEAVSMGGDEHTARFGKGLRSKVVIDQARARISKTAMEYNFDPEDPPTDEKIEKPSGEHGVYKTTKGGVAMNFFDEPSVTRKKPVLSSSLPAVAAGEGGAVKDQQQSKTAEKRKLSEVMTELKVARAEIKFAKGRSLNIEAAVKLNALVKEAVSKGGNNDPVEKMWIDQARERILKAAMKYNFDPEDPPTLTFFGEVVADTLRNKVVEAPTGNFTNEEKAGNLTDPEVKPQSNSEKLKTGLWIAAGVSVGLVALGCCLHLEH